MKKQEKLEKFEKYFCMAPWVHMSVWQTGDAYPCCIYDWQTPIGNINEGGLKGVWNSDKMRELRKNMLANKPTDGCRKCFMYEEQGILSYRHKMNKDYAHHKDLVDTTQEDGTVDKLNISYFDVRFSNLCNMKCRSCGTHFSSKWGEDLYGKPHIVEIDHPNLWEEIEELLPNIEEVYFTGGESMFMEQHYKLLDMLIERGYKPSLTYNSNASRLGLKKRHIQDYWKHFDTIDYYVSFDQVGEKAEYTRHGQPWQKIYDNLSWMRDNVPNLKLKPNPTISVLNIMDLADIIRYCFDNKFVYNFQMNINNLLITPEYLSCTILPKHLKNIAEERIIKLMNDLSTYKEMSKDAQDHMRNSLQKVIDFMWANDDTDRISEFKREMQKIDKIRKESFVDVFPEMRELYD